MLDRLEVKTNERVFPMCGREVLRDVRNDRAGRMTIHTTTVKKKVDGRTDPLLARRNRELS